MGLKAGLQILQQTTKVVSKYTDDFVGLGVRNWAKPTNLEGLRYAPHINADKFIIKHINPTEFTFKEEIVRYFQNLGIDVRLEDFSPQHFETFNLIRNDIELLNRMGLRETVPKEICLSDWRKVEKTKQILTEYGIAFPFPTERRAYCGVGTNTIFINSSEVAQAGSNGVFRKFKHEIGHRRHYTHGTHDGRLASDGSRSVLGQDVQDKEEFAKKQLQLLGIEERLLQNPNSLPYNITLSSPYNMNGKRINILPIQTPQGVRPLYIDCSKATAYLNSQCHCYNKDYLSEQIAEIFEDLLKGRRFDDLTMLMYDFSGGGRIPNMVINGKRYDDYIKTLYENKDLVNKLKEFIVIT